MWLLTISTRRWLQGEWRKSLQIQTSVDWTCRKLKDGIYSDHQITSSKTIKDSRWSGLSSPRRTSNPCRGTPPGHLLHPGHSPLVFVVVEGPPWEGRRSLTQCFFAFYRRLCVGLLESALLPHLLRGGPKRMLTTKQGCSSHCPNQSAPSPRVVDPSTLIMF